MAKETNKQQTDVKEAQDQGLNADAITGEIKAEGPSNVTTTGNGAAPAPARTSGSSAASHSARRRAASTGAARRAATISTCAKGNGRRRTRSGSGRIVRPR